MLAATTIRAKDSVIRGLQAGLKTWWWLVRIMLPISFGVALLQWLGVIALLSEWLTPLFSHIGLTAEGVLAFITGALASIYAAIGVMGTLSLDIRSVTIIAVMTLVAHNLIVESVIQRKAGAMSAWGVALFRIGAALLSAWVLNILLPADMGGTLLLERTGTADASFSGVMQGWLVASLKLMLLMFGMILGLNVLQQLLREFRLIDLLTWPLRPLMRLFGLSDDCSFLWIVLNTLGLTYGASVMISEVEAGTIPRRDARLLNVHAAMNHSMLEDTLLYVAIGIGLFWLLVPRMVLAIVSVWIVRLYEVWKKRKYRNKI